MAAVASATDADAGAGADRLGTSPLLLVRAACAGCTLAAATAPPPPPHRSRRYLLLRVFLELLIELCELLLAHQLLMRMVPLLLELLLLRMLA